MDASPTTERRDSHTGGDALARAALRIATSTIDGALTELGSLASGDRYAALEACEALRASRGSSARERAIQHMAFSLVSALFPSMGKARAATPER